MSDALATMTAEIRACRLCAEQPLKAPLPHAPNPIVVTSATARIAICGQAPGNLADQSSLPFNDPSGDRLRQWLGVDRKTFYDPQHFAIIPMGFCFPGYDKKGSDLPPRRECRAQWHDQLLPLMPQIDLFLLIGQYAQKYHLGARGRSSVTETVAQWRDHALVNQGPMRLPLPHPSWRNTAWLKRNEWFEAEIVPFLQKCVAERLVSGVDK